MGRHVVGHQHVLVVDLVERPHDLEHVHVPLVGVHFQEVVPSSPDVAEVDVEDLLSDSEIADDVVDLRPWVIEHLCGGAEAEIETVIRALLDGSELLQAFDGSEHSDDSLVALWRYAGIVRVARRSDSVLVADRDHPVKKVGDSLPSHVLGDLARSRQRSLGLRFLKAPAAVRRPSATLRATRPEDAQEAHIVLERGDSGLGAGHDHFLDMLDVAVALRTVGEQNGAAVLLIDMARGQEGKSDHR